MIYTAKYKTPLGDILLAAKDDALIGLWFEGQKYYPDFLNEEITENDNIDVIEHTKCWLDRYFRGKNPEITEQKIELLGSGFQKAVLKILCDIPYGKVITYGEISKKLAKMCGLETMSAQAVGGAVARNPISIIIPCHRVFGKNGSLTGYSGGIDKKIKLLAHEGVNTDKFFASKKKRHF